MSFICMTVILPKGEIKTQGKGVCTEDVDVDEKEFGCRACCAEMRSRA